MLYRSNLCVLYPLPIQLKPPGHMLTMLSKYLLWNNHELRRSVQTELLDQVPRGIFLVGIYGEVPEAAYEELFPDL